MADPEQDPNQFEIDLVIKPGEKIQLTFDAAGAAPAGEPVQTGPAAGATPEPPPERTAGPTWAGLRTWTAGLKGWFTRRAWLASLVSARSVFAAALAVYLVTRLVSLTDFPIYFYCDEAQNPVNAGYLLSHGFRDSYGTLLPTFFENDRKFSLGTSVYLQILPVALFGNSIFVTRAAFALVTLLAAYWLGRMLKEFFKLEIWWAGPLLLAIIPAWFILSRAAFECGVMVTFYIGGLHYYLRYRLDFDRHPNALYMAVFLFSLAFYSYAPAEVVVVFTGFLLLVVDLRYHLRQPRRRMLMAFGLLVLVTLPLVRFVLQYPNEYANRMVLYDAVWIQPVSTLGKISLYLKNFLNGLNPAYLFLPNDNEEPIYLMKGYGHLLWWLFPFVLVGLAAALRGLRRPEMRVLLLALLATPAGAAMVEIHITRILVIVAPAVILAALGFASVLAWLERRGVPRRWPAAALCVLLGLASFGMLRDALVNGPTWYQKYALNGMQYGASQVFSAAENYSQKNPDRPIFISPNWTFQSQVVRSFFVPENSPIEIGTPDAALINYQPQAEAATYVLIPDDYDKVVSSQLFKQVQVDQTLPYPNGQPGFYFVRLLYRDDAQAVFAQKEADRRKLVEEAMPLDSQNVIVRHTSLDMGPIGNIFDQDPNTLIRSQKINPLVIELEFAQPRSLSGVTLRLGSETVQASVTLYGDGPGVLASFVQQEGDSNGNKDLAMDFKRTFTVRRLHLELQDVYSPEDSFVHLWQLTLR